MLNTTSLSAAAATTAVSLAFTWFANKTNNTKNMYICVYEWVTYMRTNTIRRTCKIVYVSYNHQPVNWRPLRCNHEFFAFFFSIITIDITNDPPISSSTTNKHHHAYTVETTRLLVSRVRKDNVLNGVQDFLFVEFFFQPGIQHYIIFRS